MENNSIIANRLRKNFKHFKKWTKRENIEAYRLYDKDMPEYPYIVDVYPGHAILFERGSKDVEENVRQKHLNEIHAALCEILEITEDEIIFKVRRKQEGTNQYEKTDQKNERMIINENGYQLYVNLHDYLDTGLFLDHRPLRKQINTTSKDKSVLNLFSYTGSISVAAATGGAQVTTVDMSNTYVKWAEDNFRLNKISHRDHTFITQNVFDYLRDETEKFDIVILDPPSFSNSKKMSGIFDVQRDHNGLIRMCVDRLNQDGILYFSTNNRKFKLDEEISEMFDVKDVSFKSIPEDFKDKKIHKCYEITFIDPKND